MSQTNHKWNQPRVKLTTSEINHKLNQPRVKLVKLTMSETDHEWK